MHESSSECSDNISDDSQGIYTVSSGSDEITEAAETTFFAGEGSKNNLTCENAVA